MLTVLGIHGKKRTDTRASVESLETQLWVLSGIPSSWTQRSHSLTSALKLSGFLPGSFQLMDSLVCSNAHGTALNPVSFRTSVLQRLKYIERICTTGESS